MAKKKASKSVSKTKVSKEIKPKINPTEEKRKKINKYVFWGSWIVWFFIMLPQYLPNKCAAFFDIWTQGGFTCPPVSLAISLILGSLFMAFLTWIIAWIAVWLYFYHQELTWKNIKDFFKE